MSPDERTALFVAAQSRLKRLAYKMLGSVSLAEEAVQETYLRWHTVDLATLESPQAWLVTVLSRHCIDLLRAAKRERETYPGPWLPEPVPTGADDNDPAKLAERWSDVSMALLVLLEKLSPDERVAFLLQEVFDNDYRVLARLLGRSEAACRQLVHRARDRLAAGPGRYSVDAGQRAALLQKFVHAGVTGNLDELLATLAPDVVLYSDGGGIVKSASKPLSGVRAVSRFLAGIGAQQPADAKLRVEEINGELGLVGYRGDGQVYFVMAFALRPEGIGEIYLLNNPQKHSQFRTPAKVPSMEAQ